MVLLSCSKLMENLHIDSELADCLLNCTKGEARHWMDRLGLQRNNLQNASIPTFSSNILTRLHQSTRNVVRRPEDTYASPSPLRTAVADAGFITEHTGPLLA
jgi:hypothetical protein